MISATTSEFVRASERVNAQPFSMIEHKGLFTRLTEELARAASDLARDPRGFIRDLFSDEVKDARRRRRIYAGLGLALLVHTGLLAFIVVVGWHRMFQVKEDTNGYKVVAMVDPNGFKKTTETTEPTKPESPRANNGGGGGGGQAGLQPVSKGVLPRMLPQPQIVQPNPSNVSAPSLPVPSTLVGPETPPPPPGIAPGDPKGKEGEFSAGRGSGDGLGDGKGSGAGSGTGPGVGNGSGGSRGGGTPGSPDGTGSAIKDIDFSRLTSVPGSTGFTWTYRPTPVVTPEAQANKVSGTVLLRATFRADGTITDIEIVNPVPFMTESAVDALKRSRFRPATVNGVPVTLRRVPVRINVHY